MTEQGTRLRLAGQKEATQLLGVTPATLKAWRARFPDFPRPVAELACGPVWTVDDLERWKNDKARDETR